MRFMIHLWLHRYKNQRSAINLKNANEDVKISECTKMVYKAMCMFHIFFVDFFCCKAPTIEIICPLKSMVAI